jgi:acetyl/propionyl-CoA carboxylase alpha subunit
VDDRESRWKDAKVIKKLLIANRGEIVVRVMKTCRKLGIKTVAVYADADRNMFYLKEADEAYHIGPSNPIKSYLNIEAILDAAKQSGADAIHPGYGFLSENSRFADAVVSNGITWVGPPPAVLMAIDSKCYCRKIAADAGVPVIPGTLDTISSADELCSYASEYGYPLVLKLDKGGGGKGIEIVREDLQTKEAFERLSRIGMLAFGHPEAYIEKEVIRPRHIEIQFLADGSGNCVCLGERECSIQRRYQKIIEESPSPVVDEKERTMLFDCTVKLANAMGYQGAGTMEFLRSTEGQFYFMEVNARLQVEHPVTEFLTGIDIVEQQLRIASGESLEWRQADVRLRGHAIEARVYAEDPVSFCPSPGTISRLQFPATDPAHLRIDHAMEAGAAVPPYYDPLLAKVIAWGESRRDAVDILVRALSEFHVEGIKTTIPANLLILSNPKFLNGDLDTGFIDDLYANARPDQLSGKPLWPCM